MQNNPQLIQKNEIDLRELFATIGRYKWSIIFLTVLITMAVAIKVYFMPKYYQSTVTIEVKPEDDQSQGFSMGGAASLLLGGSAGGSTDLEKDITLLKTFRTNEKVLDKVDDYMVRYFITDKKYKEIELDNNISIEITDVKINNFKNYGMRIIVEPLNDTQYKLLFPGRFSNTLIGTYHYSEIIQTDDFSLMVHKKTTFKQLYTIELSGTKRYVYENIIAKNLNIEADKTSPFLTLSYLDTLPLRGEKYLKNLIEVYTQQSINDIKDDASIVINSYDQQLKKIETRVQESSNKLENYKIANSIIEPQAQSTALVTELSKVGIEIAQNNYKEELIKSLITFVQQHKNIDAIAPSLIELQDEPTISLIKIIQEKQLELATLYLKYKSDHPAINNEQKQIFSLQKKVLSNLKNLQTTLINKTKSLKKMEENYTKKLKSAPKQEQELISFSRDYEINQKMYTYLMQERSAAELKLNKALSRLKIIESIYTANQAIKPKKALIVIVSFITALILSISLAFFRNFIKKG
ncbi:hypothetical protein KKC13_03750 [bacterium]|nr:hypothetical protein [bacterium]MBU1957274.1 hypothetical protein [bacterium]